MLVIVVLLTQWLVLMLVLVINRLVKLVDRLQHNLRNYSDNRVHLTLSVIRVKLILVLIVILKQVVCVATLAVKLTLLLLTQVMPDHAGVLASLIRVNLDVIADAVRREYEAKTFPLPEHAVARS